MTAQNGKEAEQKDSARKELRIEIAKESSP